MTKQENPIKPYSCPVCGGQFGSDCDICLGSGMIWEPENCDKNCSSINPKIKEMMDKILNDPIIKIS